MNKTISIIVVILMIVVATPIVTFIGMYISHNDEAVRMKNGIIAQYDKDENSLAQLSLKVVDIIKIGDMSRDDAMAIITSAMKGKYGDSGATASFLWSADSPLQADISIRKQVATIIDGGRSNYEQSQNVRIDKCRQYNTSIDETIGGGMKKLIGHTKAEMKDYCTIVSSSHAKKAFATKIDSGFL